MNEHVKDGSGEATRAEVETQAWNALKKYFNGKGNGPEAKVACVVITTLAREQQAKNNARQLDIIEKRLRLTEK